MESFGSWIKCASPQLPREQKTESSAKFLHDEKKMVQRELLTKLQLRQSEDNAKKEQFQAVSNKSEIILKKFKTESLKLQGFQKTINSIKNVSSNNSSKISSFNHKFSMKSLKSEKLPKNEEVMNNCVSQIQHVNSFCITKEQELEKLKQRFKAKPSERVKTDDLKKNIVKLKNLQLCSEKISELQNSIKVVKLEMKAANEKSADSTKKLMIEKEAIKNAAERVEELHENTAVLRSQLVQLETKQSKLGNTSEVDLGIEKAENFKNSFNKEIEKIHFKIEEATKKIDVIRNSHAEQSKEFLEKEEDLKNEKERLNGVAEKKLEQLRDDINRETLKLLIIGMKQEIEYQKDELKRLEDEKGELALGMANSVSSFKLEAENLFKSVDELDEEMARLKKEEKDVDEQLASFESHDSVDMETPKISRNRSSKSDFPAHDLTAEIEELRESMDSSLSSSINSSLNTDLTLSPILAKEKVLNKRRAEENKKSSELQKKTTVRFQKSVSKNDSFDMFEQADRLAPLLTSTPIVEGYRKTTRAAAIKARKSIEIETPTVKKTASRGRGGRKRGGKRGSK